MSLVDPTNVFDTKPLVGMPAWWRTFIFHVLNSRQLSVYMYLVMLMDGEAACSPTVEEIAREVGLLSTTMVFEAINALEQNGFILRARTASPLARARRNIYQRPSCEYTILRLLRTGKIDAAPESALQSLLGDTYPLYAVAPNGEKQECLMATLEAMLDQRQQSISA